MKRNISLNEEAARIAQDLIDKLEEQTGVRVSVPQLVHGLLRKAKDNPQ